MEGKVYRKSFNDNKLYFDGEYRITQRRFLFRASNSYDFDECINISDLLIYDEQDSKSKQLKNIKSLFGSDVMHILQSKKYHRLIFISTDEAKQIKSYKYSQEVSSEDISSIISNIRYSKMAF